MKRIQNIFCLLIIMMGITSAFSQSSQELYPKIKRLEGQGNGGNWLELTESTRNSIMAGAPWKVQQPEYESGASPVTVRVTNPAELQPYEYRLGIIPAGALDGSLVGGGSHWELKWYLDGIFSGAYQSQFTIGEGKEEIIPGHGIAITMKDHPFSIHDKYLAMYVNNHGGQTYQNNAWYAQPDLIGSQVTYSGPDQWLDGLKDVETPTPDNWIRAGNYRSTFNWSCINSSNAQCAYTKWRTEDCFNLFNGSYNATRGWIDYYGQFEHVVQGTWAPYVLGSPYDGGPKAKYLTKDVELGDNEPSPAYFSFQQLNAISYAGGYNQTMTNLYSVDIVLTSDTSLWTRALVLESGSGTSENNYIITQHFNGHTYQNLRHEPKHCPSVDKNGNPDNSGTTGFGWFPGYAINVETGERLNIMFAENSEDEYNRGNDMIFNPTNVYAFQKDNEGNYILDTGGNPVPMSQDDYNVLYSSSVCNHETLGEPLYGGRHYVYVCGSSGNTANTFYRDSYKQRNYNNDDEPISGFFYPSVGGTFMGSDGVSYPYFECGVYDEGQWLKEKFNTLTETDYNSNVRKSKKMQVFNNVMWTGIPMPARGLEAEWLANNATVSIRVSRPYMFYTSEVGSGPNNPENDNAPFFSFTTSDLNTAQTYNLYDLSENMANNENRININNIDAPVSPHGGAWFFDGDGAISDLHITDNFDKQTLLNYSFWMGGLDNDNQLHLFGERYRLNGHDTWPGPLSTVNASIDEETMLQWNRTFKITRKEVLEFKANYQNPDYIIPQHILNWPAHGDTTKGQSWLLAPFTDVDGDNHYDPTQGDHPDFPGDMAQFVIFNDNYAQHGESQGVPMGVETHVMVYAFDAPEDSVMNNTLFFNYKLFNRSQNNYHDTYIGMYCDWDMGYAYDDYVGVDIGWNSAYCYNGTEIDGSGQSYAWGANWPVQTLTLLAGPYMPSDSVDNPAYTESMDCSTFINNGLNEYAINGTSGFGDGAVDNERYGLTGFTYHNNDNSVTGPPQTAAEYYNMIHSFWKDNSHVKYGGYGHSSNGSSDINCRFMFPGNSSPCDYNTYGIQIPQSQQYSESGWTESAAGNTPSDRSGLSSVGPFNLDSGGMQELDFCMVTLPHEYAVTPTGITLDSLYRVNPNYRSQLFVNPVVHDYFASICNGDSIVFFGNSYTESGLFSHYVSNSFHSNDIADTIHCLHLTVTPPYTFYEASACDSLVWGDSTYTVSGDYVRTFSTENGCDSTVMLRLTINSTKNVEYVSIICSDYNWHDQIYYETGTYTYEYINENGCECTDTLHLTELPAFAEEISVFACDSFSLNGFTYSESGDYTQYVDTMLFRFIVWMDGHWGHYDETSGVFYYFRPNGWSDLIVDGYDDFGNPSYVYYDQNGTAHSYTPGEVIDISNQIHDIPSCKIITLHLTINPFVESVEATACNTYTYNGITYTESGDYTFNSDTMIVTQREAELCDSYEDSEYRGELWCIQDQYGNLIDWADFYINKLTGDTLVYDNDWNLVPGTPILPVVYDTILACKITILHLTITPSVTESVNVTACESYEWNDQTYTVSGNYTQTFETAEGCDSTVTLHLTVNNAVNTETTVGSCGSYEWNGETYTASGDYTQTFTAANGCDSVVTLHLTLNQPTTGTDEQTACESFTWIDGNTYTESTNVPTYTLTNAAGCDSVVTLHLTVNHPVHTAIAAESCGSYSWNGNTYNESGDYTYSHTDANGCTQVDTLHLTINYSTTGTDVQTACGSFTWIDGITYTESNSTATYTLTNAAGCDSVVTLNLAIFSDETSDLSVTTPDSCYTWNSETYCTSGDYTQTFQTVHGCDSVVTLHLTITVGIDDHNLAASMTVYPNPTTGIVNVQCTINNVQVGTMDILVYDAFGRLLRTTDGVETQNFASLQTDTHGSSVQTPIDLSRYAPGVYLIKAVADGNVVAVRKIVKH